MPTPTGEAPTVGPVLETATAEPSSVAADAAATPAVEPAKETSATAEGAPAAAVPAVRPQRGLDDQQKCLLAFTRPWWLRGEASIPQQVHALVHDHGMDYSAAGLDCALAWLLIQRRDFAIHLRAWMAARMVPGHDPARVLDELDYYLLSLEEA